MTLFVPPATVDLNAANDRDSRGAGRVVALIGAAVMRVHWKLFVGLALALLAFTLAYFSVGSSGIGSSGVAG